MRERKPVTPFGWKVLQKLAERNMTRRQFCAKYDIPETRFSEIIRGARRATNHRNKIARVLGIDESSMDRKAE